MTLPRAILICCCWLQYSAAWADTFNAEGLKGCGTITAQKALDGGRFTGTDGRTIKLALIKAPELWEKGAPYKSWPHARKAKEALETLINGRQVTLYCEGATTNRFGETVAHALLPDGRSVQQLLVSGGHAIVFPRPARQRGLDMLIKAEDMARKNKAGLWAFGGYHPVNALSDDIKTGWFQIVTGTVLRAEKVGPTLYLNFGDDWRTDFTVEIPDDALRHFGKTGFDPAGSADKRIEVRGWVDYKAGPRILIHGPSQLRILE